MEKIDEKGKWFTKVMCRSEAVLNLNQEPLTPGPYVHSSSFFAVMFPYSQKHCVFTAPVFFMCIWKAQKHWNLVTAKLGTQ